jgi:hypothetical protein
MESVANGRGSANVTADQVRLFSQIHRTSGVVSLLSNGAIEELSNDSYYSRSSALFVVRSDVPVQPTLSCFFS